MYSLANRLKSFTTMQSTAPDLHRPSMRLTSGRSKLDPLNPSSTNSSTGWQASSGSPSTNDRSMARWLAMELLTAPSPSRSPSALESLMYSAIMRASPLWRAPCRASRRT